MIRPSDDSNLGQLRAKGSSAQLTFLMWLPGGGCSRIVKFSGVTAFCTPDGGKDASDGPPCWLRPRAAAALLKARRSGLFPRRGRAADKPWLAPYPGERPDERCRGRGGQAGPRGRRSHPFIPGQNKACCPAIGHRPLVTRQTLSCPLPVGAPGPGKCPAQGPSMFPGITAPSPGWQMPRWASSLEYGMCPYTLKRHHGRSPWCSTGTPVCVRHTRQRRPVCIVGEQCGGP